MINLKLIKLLLETLSATDILSSLNQRCKAIPPNRWKPQVEANLIMGRKQKI